jgi:hypothetical protein
MSIDAHHTTPQTGTSPTRGAVAKRALRLLAAVALLTLTLVPVASAEGTPTISVVSPAPGETVTTTDIVVQVTTSNIDTACQWVGTADTAGQGNIHVFLDEAALGSLINFYCGSDTFTIPGEGITPGPHTLLIDLASNTHGDMADTMQQVEIDYQPETPKPLPAAQATDATPTIQIVSPADGATIDSQFTLQLESTNFTPNCALEGKAAVAGFGHYHVVVDAETAPSPLAGLIAMPCDASVPLDLSGWSAGQHTLMVALAQNDHSPVPNAEMASITFTLGDSSGAVGAVLPNTGAPESDGFGFGAAILVLAVLGVGLVAVGTLLRRRRARIL